MNMSFYKQIMNLEFLLLILFSGLWLYQLFHSFNVVENLANKKKKKKVKKEELDEEKEEENKMKKENEIKKDIPKIIKKQELKKPLPVDSKPVAESVCDMNTYMNRIFLEEVENITSKIKSQHNVSKDAMNTNIINQKALENSQRIAQQNLENAINGINETYLDTTEFINVSEEETN